MAKTGLKSIVCPKIELINGDCMDYMKDMPDNAYELAICDPPYGIGMSKDERFGQKFKKSCATRADYKKSDWDNSVPDKNYFWELFRVSKNQIIWGANYYGLKGGYIFWDKCTAEDYSNSAGELAYCSIGSSVQKFTFTWNGMLQEHMKNKEFRIHPTQKPVKLYEWLLKNYAKEGDKILDTHLGSMSSVIACINMNHSITGFEIDKDYYDAGMKRVEEHKKQQRLFV